MATTTSVLPYRLVIAHHEVGHAVTAALLDVPFRRVRIWSGGLFVRTTRGEVDLPADGGGVSADVCAIVSLAGPVAEARAAGGSYRAALRRAESSSKVDMRAVRAVLREPGATLTIDSARRQAEQLVRAHWPSIERLAVELDRRGEISASKVRGAL